MSKLLIFLLLLTGLAGARESLQYGGIERTYYVHLPPGYDGKKALPLLILLHGGGGGAQQALRNYPLAEVADREGFILVAPNGTGPRPIELLRTWNVVFGWGHAQEHNVDDNGFLRALILKLEGSLKVDPKRVYLTGLSNGGVLCHFAGAANADLIAGIAPVVGTVAGRNEEEKELHYPVRPSRPLDVIMFNGSLDEHVPPQGGLQTKSMGKRKFLASSEESAHFWVQANGCNPQGVVEELPAQKATRTTWSGGRNGTRVVLYILHNQGHAWPGGSTPRGQADRPSQLVKAHEVLWKFFQTR